MRRVGRSTFRYIYWLTLFGLWFGGSIVFGLVRLTPLEGIGVAAALSWGVWLFAGRWIAAWLVPAFVSRIRCPGCREVIDAVGVWNCSCGYHDYKERHILAGRCPKCGEGTGHTQCPRCSATILLW